MLKRLMLNLKAIGDTRHAYAGCDAFDVKRSSKHTVQDPLPDQARVMWFCVKEGFFQHNDGASPNMYATTATDSDASPNKVKNMFINVYQKGQEKVKKHFSKKLYDSFPEWWELVLDRASLIDDVSSC